MESSEQGFHTKNRKPNPRKRPRLSGIQPDIVVTQQASASSWPDGERLTLAALEVRLNQQTHQDKLSKAEGNRQLKIQCSLTVTLSNSTTMVPDYTGTMMVSGSKSP